MSENPQVKPYERKLTPIERTFTHSPYAIVTVVARIKGDISEQMLLDAVAKVRQRHPHLRSRIKEDANHDSWLTLDGAKDIPVEIVPRESDDHWIRVVQESCQIPFDFAARPAIRFILVQSPSVSELVILCHHIICDGLSLAYLARDVLVHLGDPTLPVEVLSDPVIFDLNTMPKDVSLNPIVKFFVNRYNRQWAKNRVVFDQTDYCDLSKTYWTHFTHQMLLVELSEAETSALVARSKHEGVTVNSALTAAFAGAQVVVQGDKPFHPSLIVAGSLRDRLQQPVGEVMGLYASAVILKHPYQANRDFWENARRLHQKLKPSFTNKNLFKNQLIWCHLDPTLLEAINFKRIGHLVPTHFARHQKLSDFSKRNDVVLSILKRDKMDTLDHIFMGTAVTNLTRMDFPTEYGALTLDRLIMKPGGGYPLATINLVLGAVTCAGKLSLVIEYAEETVATSTMEKIKDKALELLL